MADKNQNQTRNSLPPSSYYFDIFNFFFKKNYVSNYWRFLAILAIIYFIYAPLYFAYYVCLIAEIPIFIFSFNLGHCIFSDIIINLNQWFIGDNMHLSLLPPDIQNSGIKLNTLFRWIFYDDSVWVVNKQTSKAPADFTIISIFYGWLRTGSILALIIITVSIAIAILLAISAITFIFGVISFPIFYFFLLLNPEFIENTLLWFLEFDLLRSIADLFRLSNFHFTIIRSDFLSIFPELFLFASSTFIFCILLYWSIAKKHSIFFFSSVLRSFRYIYLIIVITLLLYNSYEIFYFESFYSNLVSYWYICVFKEFCLILMFFFFFALKEYMEFSEFLSFEILILFSFIFISFLFLLSANSFLMIYLLLEIYNLSIYSVIGLRRNSNKSVESAIKYFIFGSFSSILLLYASSLIYGTSSFINFTDLSLFFWNNQNLSLVTVVGVLIFFISFLFKMGIAPLHSWAVEVYSGAPLIITFFLTLIPKLVFIIILLRLYADIFFEFSYIITPLIYFFLFSTAIIGVFGALFQIK